MKIHIYYYKLLTFIKNIKLIFYFEVLFFKLRPNRSSDFNIIFVDYFHDQPLILILNLKYLKVDFRIF